MLAKVLLVEHDATIASELEIGLRANGCDVTLPMARRGSRARRAIASMSSFCPASCPA
jgi:hypothetical protein